MAGPAEPRPESDACHERGVVGLPDRLALEVASNHDALHVVREDVFGHPHHHEGVDHADGQVLLARVREELDVARAAVVAHHREAGDLERAARPIPHLDEAPVHLIGLAWVGPATPAAASLGILPGDPPLGGHEVGVRADVVLDGGLASLVALARDSLEYHLGIGDALGENTSTQLVRLSNRA